jgi:hypothetical protein
MQNSIRTTTLLLVLSASTALAQSGVRLEARSDSKLWLEGTSNLMSWSCRATAIDAAVDVESVPRREDAAAIAGALERVVVRVPVGNLKCGNRHMDRNMYRALDADRPEESYIVGSFAVEAVSGLTTPTVHTTGVLTVAGRDRSVDVDVRTRRADDGSIIAEGALPILMTDFGIRPPTALFGAIRTGNRVMVHFELHVPTESSVAIAASSAAAGQP